MNFSDLYCRYKYVLEMSPIKAKVSDVKAKLLTKHKKEFLRMKQDFFLSPYYYDNGDNIYVQLAIDFDKGFNECKTFLRSVKNPSAFVVEVTNPNKCHLLSRYVVKFPQDTFNISEHRKRVISKFSNIDKIASQNVNPFRRFPSRSSNHDFRVYPLSGSIFKRLSNSEINSRFKRFTVTPQTYPILLNAYVFDIAIFDYDPEGVL